MKNFIKEDQQERLDDKMQKGYQYSEKGDSVAACHEWSEVWKDIMTIMDSNDIKHIEDMDEAFEGRQCIYNWSSDFEMELGNASNKDISFAQMRIDFCSEYIKRYKDKKELNLWCMKRAIAESFFKLGQSEQGDLLFQKYLAELPEWGWGWIGWSDQYWLFGENKDKNSGKAIDILKKALEVKGLEDRIEVLARLKDIYNDLGMREEADAINIDREMPGIPLSKFNDLAMLGKRENYKALANLGLAVESARKTKVGRNDPCPCGSGKKYKKCCLR